MRSAMFAVVLILVTGCRQSWDGFKNELADLKSPDADTRAFAASRLGGHGSEAKISLPALESALKDENPSVRVEAANAIWRIDPEKKGVAIPIFAAAVDVGMVDGHASLAKNLSIKYLGELGPEAIEAIPKLKRCLKTGNDYERVIAARAMTRIDKSTYDIAFPVLAEGLKNQDQGTKIEAAQAFCNLGRDAKEFIPKVRLLLEDEDEFTRNCVARALKAMEKEQ